MTRSRPPRYQSSDASRAAELHDQHMEALVAAYTAQRHTGHPQTSYDDLDADPAPVDPSKELPA